MTDKQKRTQRGRPKTFDREGVLAAAMTAYWREGPSGLSLNEVCRRAGVSKPGLYREFGDEDGLIDAVVSLYAKQMLEPAWAMTRKDQPFSHTLQNMVDFMTNGSESRPIGCLYAKMQSSPTKLGPKSQAHLQQIRERAIATYASWLEGARARKEIADQVCIEVAAEFLHAQFVHILSQVAAGEEADNIRAQAELAFAGLSSA